MDLLVDVYLPLRLDRVCLPFGFDRGEGESGLAVDALGIFAGFAFQWTVDFCGGDVAGANCLSGICLYAALLAAGVGIAAQEVRELFMVAIGIGNAEDQ